MNAVRPGGRISHGSSCPCRPCSSPPAMKRESGWPFWATGGFGKAPAGRMVRPWFPRRHGRLVPFASCSGPGDFHAPHVLC
jgi:hypothetical protein